MHTSVEVRLTGDLKEGKEKMHIILTYLSLEEEEEEKYPQKTITQ